MKPNLPQFQIRCDEQVFTVRSLSLNDMMTDRFWSQGRFYESKVLTMVRAFNLEGTYIDVGANMGNHSIFFLNCCRCTKLIAIEAVWDVYEVMVHNVTSNNPRDIPFEPMHWAVAERGGMIATWDCVDPHNIGGTQMQVRDRTADDTTRVDRNRSVLTARIDDLVKATENVAVIKLDIEGGEAHAIVGAYETIARCQPLLIAEATTPHNVNQLDDMLRRLGYMRCPRTPKKHTYLWWSKPLAQWPVY